MDRKFRVGVIRVLTSDDPEFVSMHGRFIEEHYPGSNAYPNAFRISGRESTAMSWSASPCRKLWRRRRPSRMWT